MIPSPPFSHLGEEKSTSKGTKVWKLETLEESIEKSEETRQAAYDLSRRANKALIACRIVVEKEGIIDCENQQEKELDSIMKQVFANDKNNASQEGGEHEELPPREANLTYRVEDYIRFKSFCYFLQTGKLIPQSDFFKRGFQINDEEYLSGACIGLSKDLERYAIGRATARDALSVNLSRNIVSQILHQLMQFDFRNGPLRRKYDGTKYALKTLETILYELSVTSPNGNNEADSEYGITPEFKKAKLSNDDIIPLDELEELRKRMEERDEAREKLIKRCRDAQKSSKNAVFALHRGNTQQALKLIQLAEAAIQNDLMPIANKVPSLRNSGSLTGVLEEFIEAKMFYHWMLSHTSTDKNSDKVYGTILTIDDFAYLNVMPVEYLGGLCDLTGEVGRYAVRCGTNRDKEGVQFCLRTNSSIRDEIDCLPRIPSLINKKMAALRVSIEKLERILYELSLVEATGRKHFKADSINTMQDDDDSQTREDT